MKSIKCDIFLEHLSIHQLMDFSNQIYRQLTQEVQPFIPDDMICLPFYHFIEVKAPFTKTLYVSCLSLYMKRNGRVVSTIEEVKVYDNKDERDLYIQVRAYECITPENHWIFQ